MNAYKPRSWKTGVDKKNYNSVIPLGDNLLLEDTKSDNHEIF